MDDFFHGEGLVDDILDEVEADTADLRSAQGPNRLREIAFYPLDSRISNGFSSLRMVDFAQNLAPGGAAGYTSANALYARACEKDKAKLLKSAALLHQGEQFALKASGYRRGNPPLYLKLYKGAHASSAREGDQSECLLGQPIDQLFSNMIERPDHSPARREAAAPKLVRKRKRQGATSDLNESWLIKYQPRYFSDLLTEEPINFEVLNWLSGWKCSRLYNSARVPQQRMQHSERRGKRPLSGDRKPEENVDTDADNRKVLLLGGPAGVGKSTVVNVLARHCGFDVVEINASEDRSKAKILPTIKGIITTNAISKNRPNLCLLEEVDGLHAAEGQVIDAIKELNQKNLIKRPIVCICNDLYHKNLRELRQIAKVVVVESCDTEALKHRLFSIADMEGYKVSDQLVEDLLNLHQNDIRSCITALEFLIKNPGLASNLDTFSKDKTQGLTTFLRDLFNPRSSPQALREGSDAVSATIGLQTLSNLIAENVVKVGTRSLFNAIALFDVMVQGDVIHNSLWMQAALSLVKLMRLKSAFKFILPGTLSSHAYGQRVAKNGAVIRAIRRHAMVASSTLSNSFNVQILPAICSIALAAAGASGSWSSLSRRLEEVDVLWQAFAPIKDDALNRVIRMAVLLQVYGINVIEVKGQLTLDPPLLELSSASRNYIGQELCRIVQQIHNGWGSPASVGRPKHLQGYLQEIGRLGYAAFARKFATEVTDEVEREVKRLCRKNGATVPPITFAELLAQEYSHLAQLLSEGGIDADARTCGVYKFHGEKCGAVRYILNDI